MEKDSPYQLKEPESNTLLAETSARQDLEHHLSTTIAASLLRDWLTYMVTSLDAFSGAQLEDVLKGCALIQKGLANMTASNILLASRSFAEARLVAMISVARELSGSTLWGIVRLASLFNQQATNRVPVVQLLSSTSRRPSLPITGHIRRGPPLLFATQSLPSPCNHNICSPFSSVMEEVAWCQHNPVLSPYEGPLLGCLSGLQNGRDCGLDQIAELWAWVEEMEWPNYCSTMLSVILATLFTSQRFHHRTFIERHDEVGLLVVEEESRPEQQHETAREDSSAATGSPAGETGKAGSG
ncbi:hypothetical protein Pmani_001782 [Petrolisthes manimaculis]|uniref:Uncharacterized protein n=1 Tax=Petrolisthes manimaculis TaxID=1843537 RepID=A0AAE1UR69_9EUCA|nr:hypothetical protein Pmani_001782 [Petrolisthes manimaculis]